MLPYNMQFLVCKIILVQVIVIENKGWVSTTVTQLAPLNN